METERIIEILEQTQTKRESDVDRRFAAIELLRKRVPVKVCGAMPSAAEHDVLYICQIDEAAPYLSEEDVVALGEYGVHESYEAFALFV